MEMETFQLLHLGLCATELKTTSDLHAAAAAIILANRETNEFLSSARLREVEMEAGRGVLRSLTEMTLEGVDT